MLKVPDWIQTTSDWIHAKTNQDCYMQGFYMLALASVLVLSLIVCNILVLSHPILSGPNTYIIMFALGMETRVAQNSGQPLLMALEKNLPHSREFLKLFACWVFVLVVEYFTDLSVSEVSLLTIGAMMIRGAAALKKQHAQYENDFASGAWAAIKPINSFLKMSLYASLAVSIAVASMIAYKLASMHERSLVLLAPDILLLMACLGSLLGCSAASCRPRPPGYSVRSKNTKTSRNVLYSGA